MQTKNKPLCVVLDANIWVQQLLLKSSLGAALLYGLNQVQGFIGLPEIVEMEATKQVVAVGEDAVTAVRRNLTTIQVIVGEIPEHNLPTSEAFEAHVLDRLTQLKDMVIRVELTLEQCKAALQRVVEGTPPNRARKENKEKKEEFRDSLVWEVVLELAQSYDLHFVTSDSDFYEGYNPQKGLANSLVKECSDAGTNVFTYPDLGSFLKVLNSHVPALDSDQIAAAIDSQINDTLRDYATKYNFALNQLSHSSTDAFLTEKLNMLALNFTLDYRVSDIQQDDITFPEGKLIVKGSCIYNDINHLISEVQFYRIDYIGPHGERIAQKSTTFVYPNAIIGIGGPKPLPYTLRKKLP